MKLLKGLFRFLFSRRLWTFIGLVLLCILIWLYGGLVKIGEVAPLDQDLVRLIVIAVIAVAWLVSLLLAQMRAIRANRMFVTELAQPAPKRAPRPGEAAMAEVSGKFQSIMAEMKKSKLGGRKFLREMPWYVIIGPPGTGKTTALRQSGLHFPIDLTDDLKGVGGTRNCDWFFTEDAVLIDTAGRYVEQQSAPEADAAEWQGFLDLLKKHRGKRALNGVILTLSVQELLGDETALRAHGREIRKRLAELRDRLGIRLPVYLMVTKADLIPGFEAYFGALGTREREQVWGATLSTDARIDATGIGRELKALSAELEKRLVGRLAEDVALDRRAEVFRFPAQVERVGAPLKVLIDAVFGESRYEETPWLRGFYFTSATQEGSPIDRLVGEMARGFGIGAEPAPARRHAERRSFFLRNLLTEVIFREAGLGTFDAAAEERRKWLWRGALGGSVLAVALASMAFLYAFVRYSGAIADQALLLEGLQARLTNVAARQAPVDPPDIDLALEAVTEVQAAATGVDPGLAGWTGPRASAEIARAQKIAYDHSLRNILEPRMVALLEATMWRQIRDPEYLLGAMKVYQMMTGRAVFNEEFAAAWWQDSLPLAAPVNPFPTESARAHQLAAITRMAGEEAASQIQPDPALVQAALESICQIPLSVRAYNALMADPAVSGLPEWLPGDHAGPNGARVLTRLSEKTLRVGLPGAFTYDGFHGTILPLVPEVAAQAAIDRDVFAGGCADSSGGTVDDIEAEVLKLYYDDFIAQWDGFLRDVRLAPIPDLRIATENLKDLASTDSALKRLLRAVVAETDLIRVAEGDASGGPPPGLINKALSKLGTVGKLAKQGSRIAAASGGGGAPAEPDGQRVADHFRPIKATIEEVDGNPPLLDAAVAALAALSQELLTVTASPDPEGALLARGGLAELTGAVANEAAALPDPLDDWVAGIAGDTGAVTRDAVIARLNARWRADVLPFCTAATAGRYPFDEGSRIDINGPDFQRLFGTGGLMDVFINEQLLPYVDVTARPWSWRADLGLDAAGLQPFEQARRMRDALFPGGGALMINFWLTGTDLSPNASRVDLNVDGQTLQYFNQASQPVAMTWPGRDGTNTVTLAFTPLDGATQQITSETGSWAWLRMIRKGALSPGAQPELFALRLGHAGFSASFELRAQSVENPFDMTIFGNFRCPDKF
jgi:type VI secretion system protein ImpL